MRYLLLVVLFVALAPTSASASGFCDGHTLCDDFNRSDGALGSAVVGGAWHFIEGNSLLVNSGQLAYGGGQSAAVLNAGTADGVLSARVVDQRGWFGLVFRTTASGDGWTVLFSDATTLHIYKRSGSDVYNQLSISPPSFNVLNGDYIQVSMLGSALSLLLLDGGSQTVLWSTTDAYDSTNTYMGVELTGSAGQQGLDDFVFDAAASPTPTPTATTVPTSTPTATMAPTVVPTATTGPSSTPTASRTPTVGPSPTASNTPTASRTPTVGPSPTASNTPTASSTPTVAPLRLILSADVASSGLLVLMHWTDPRPSNGVYSFIFYDRGVQFAQCDPGVCNGADGLAFNSTPCTTYALSIYSVSPAASSNVLELTTPCVGSPTPTASPAVRALHISLTQVQLSGSGWQVTLNWTDTAGVDLAGYTLHDLHNGVDDLVHVGGSGTGYVQFLSYGSFSWYICAVSGAPCSNYVTYAQQSPSPTATAVAASPTATVAPGQPTSTLGPTATRTPSLTAVATLPPTSTPVPGTPLPTATASPTFAPTSTTVPTPTATPNSPCGSGGLLACDDFNRAGPDLGNATSGQAWQAVEGVLSDVGLALDQVAWLGSSQDRLGVDVGIQDQDASVAIYRCAGIGRWAGVGVRWGGTATTGWALVCHGGTGISLYSVLNGVYTSVYGPDVRGVVDGDVLRLVASGSAIRAYFNGTLLYATNTCTTGGTLAGVFFTWDGSSATHGQALDNFTVAAPPAGSSVGCGTPVPTGVVPTSTPGIPTPTTGSGPTPTTGSGPSPTTGSGPTPTTGSGPSPTTVANPDDGKPCYKAAQALVSLFSTGNVPYCWGSNTPNVYQPGLVGGGPNGENACPTGIGLDCSGSVIWSLQQAGFSLPDMTAAGLYNYFPHVGCGLTDMGCKEIGDLLFFVADVNGAPQHVATYVGGGSLGDCYNTGTGCVIHPIGSFTYENTTYIGAARPSSKSGFGAPCGDSGVAGGGSPGSSSGEGDDWPPIQWLWDQMSGALNQLHTDLSGLSSQIVSGLTAAFVPSENDWQDLNTQMQPMYGAEPVGTIKDLTVFLGTMQRGLASADINAPIADTPLAWEGGSSDWTSALRWVSIGSITSSAGNVVSMVGTKLGPLAGVIRLVSTVCCYLMLFSYIRSRVTFAA